MVTGVMAIPSLGFIIVTVAGVDGVIGVCVFVVCCWAATYFAIHMFNHPNMHKKRDFTRE